MLFSGRWRRKACAHLGDGSVHAFDLILIGIGALPADELAGAGGRPDLRQRYRRRYRGSNQPGRHLRHWRCHLTHPDLLPTAASGSPSVPGRPRTGQAGRPRPLPAIARLRSKRPGSGPINMKSSCRSPACCNRTRAPCCAVIRQAGGILDLPSRCREPLARCRKRQSPGRFHGRQAVDRQGRASG